MKIKQGMLYILATGMLLLCTTTCDNPWVIENTNVLFKDKEYSIGDIGPAGGIVFYDKGNSSGGWRYLEAAPTDAPGSISWGPTGFTAATSDSLGTGKQNTLNIIAGLDSISDFTLYAARVCDNFSYGGENDWFLPSYDELFLMYDNLYRAAALGSFAAYYYWSSSMDTWAFVKCHNFATGYSYSDMLTGVNCVRAIRAF